jgi:hypothetical protein
MNRKEYKLLERGNCPYCDAQRGQPSAWGMSHEGMIQVFEDHQNGHPCNNAASYHIEFKDGVIRNIV